MLAELHISNYALIESLKVEFFSGLNVLTGETGAGKSIIVDALGHLLGDKASASIVRKSAERARITGLFDVSKNREILNFIRELSLPEPEEGLLVLRREIDAQGKSRAFINDEPVNVSTLQALGEKVVEIHGQNQHQSLLRNEDQREFLDRFGDHGSLRLEVAEAYAAWKALSEEKEKSRISEQEKNQKIDLYRFQVQEIDEAKLSPGEEDEIEQALPRLKNAEKVRGLLEEVFFNLYEEEGAVLERLRKSQKSLQQILSLGVDLKEIPGLLEDSLVRVGELSNQIESLRDKTISDPRALDGLISRQDLIAKLKRKYGSTVSEILSYRGRVAEELNKLENHARSLKDLEDKIAQAQDQLLKRSGKLSASRKKVAEDLSRRAEKELKDLGFLKARFEAGLIAEKDADGNSRPSPSGLERVEFLFSANPGEDLKPLKHVASGGELSRVMLALKKILAQVDSVPVLIFDEVDSGIGGSMGHVIGEKLKTLGKTHQVLAITHLPQIAAFAHRHIRVRKSVIDKRTQTAVEFLEKGERVQEIARMLGGVTPDGEKPTSASLKHAEELLQQSQR